MNEKDPNSAEARYAEVHKTYEGKGITIHWEPRFCIHAGECFRGQPNVFAPRERPWVTPDGAPPEAIAETIMRCPTGALHFERTDGGPQESATDDVTITPIANGPSYLRGRVRIEAPDGTVLREDTRVALCRCGASENKPFCDNSHTRVKFRADGR